MIVRTVRVSNRLGLHARAASKLVQLAQEFDADINILNGAQPANGKSIMSLMMLQATQGTELQLEAQGTDEVVAVESIVALFEGKFGEED